MLYLILSLQSKLQELRDVSDKGLGSVEEARLQTELENVCRERDRLQHHLQAGLHCDYRS